MNSSLFNLTVLTMNTLSAVSAGFIYFLLGVPWFSLLFGKAWERAIGYKRPEGTNYPLLYYIGPLVGCLFAAISIALIIDFMEPETMTQAIRVGIIMGVGYGFMITGINAIMPVIPRPALYTAITGTYHVVGAIICAAMAYTW